MNFKEELDYMEEEYDGIASLAFYRALGGMRCRTMSYKNAYIKCCEELRKIYKEHPELLDKEIKFNQFVADTSDLNYDDEIDWILNEDDVDCIIENTGNVKEGMGSIALNVDKYSREEKKDVCKCGHIQNNHYFDGLGNSVCTHCDCEKFEDVSKEVKGE